MIINCPFLSKLPTSFLNRYSSTLMANYGSFCPFASSFVRYFSDLPNDTIHSTSNNTKDHEKFQDQTSCPFLKNVKPTLSTPSPDTIQDIVNHDSDEFIHNKDIFSYQKFFRDQILLKKKDHSYRIFKKVSRLADKPPFAEEKTASTKFVTVWCSNDYLGMSAHPAVKQDVINTVSKYGSGSGGTRNISGNTPFHEELEKEMASLHQKQAALLFTSCFVANDTTLFTLGKLIPDVHIFSDSGNHASMIQGIRNSGAPKHIFSYKSPEKLEKMLQSLNKKIPKIVAFETVHSMTGDISPVGLLCNIAHEYGAITYVDEVHALGLYGYNGAGIGERDGVMDSIDILSGTLGKAIGNVGGYIAGDKYLVDMIRSYASGFIFTTSLPPTICRGALKAVQILRSDEGRALRGLHQYNVTTLKSLLSQAGLPMMPSPSHIIPLLVSDAALCTHISNTLMKRGHYVQSINYPTVPKGTERLRIAPTPFHTEEMMKELVSELIFIWDALGLERKDPKIPTQMETCAYCNRVIDLGPCDLQLDCPRLVTAH